MQFFIQDKFKEWAELEGDKAAELLEQLSRWLAPENGMAQAEKYVQAPGENNGTMEGR